MNKKRKRIGSIYKDTKVGYLMSLPFFIFFFFFVFLPVIINFFLSFTNYNLLTYKFVGFKNYINIFTDKLFLLSVKNTLKYALYTVILVMVSSFFLAVLLNKNLWIMKFARTLLYLPHVTSMVAVSMIWLWLYEPSGGTFNQILNMLGFRSVNWLIQTSTALGSVIAMGVWKSIGYNMLIFLAGLQDIPNELYESAEIDGARLIHKIRYITIPLLRPVTFFIFVTNSINCFNVFEQVNVMTSGGPLNSTTTIVHQIYTRAFTEFYVGYAAAMAIVLAAAVFVFTMLSFKLGSTSPTS
jgi:ABC-type sugar transport system permease subunit